MKRVFSLMVLCCCFSVPAFGETAMTMELEGEFHIAFSLPDNKAFLSSNPTHNQSYVINPFFHAQYMESEEFWTKWRAEDFLYFDFGQPLKVSTWGLNGKAYEVSKSDGIVPFIMGGFSGSNGNILVPCDTSFTMVPYNEKVEHEGVLGWDNATCFDFDQSVTVRNG